MSASRPRRLGQEDVPVQMRLTLEVSCAGAPQAVTVRGTHGDLEPKAGVGVVEVAAEHAA
jgi:hypothetical protein